MKLDKEIRKELREAALKHEPLSIGASRLPLWCFIGWAIQDGFRTAADDYYSDGYYDTFDEKAAAEFLSCLFDQRGEFARLILLLADAERCERHSGKWWWETKRHRKRIADQLRRCLALVDPETGSPQ